jgi:hypothetical protein
LVFPRTKIFPAKLFWFLQKLFRFPANQKFFWRNVLGFCKGEGV